MKAFRATLEYAAVWLLLHALGLLSRRAARALGAGLGRVAFHLFARLRAVGERNLAIALPEQPEDQRGAILRRMYRNLGWQLAEFCQMSRYTPENTRDFLRYDGLEHFRAAEARGKGVLIVTGHLGAWELSSFYHSLMGHPMSMVIRRLDNPRVDALVNRVRCMHGNQVLHKDNFARGLLAAMRQNRAVGILMDTNMTPPQGVFVPYFGMEACTASGLARVALKTDATVIPGFLLWRDEEQKYVLTFGAPLDFARSGEDDRDIVAATALCTAAIERYVRAYPDQWLWVHRRWKTRPPGEPRLYD